MPTRIDRFMRGGDVSGDLKKRAEERLEVLKQIAVKGRVDVTSGDIAARLSTAIIYLEKEEFGRFFFTPVEPLMLGAIQSYLGEKGNELNQYLLNKASLCCS